MLFSVNTLEDIKILLYDIILDTKPSTHNNTSRLTHLLVPVRIPFRFLVLEYFVVPLFYSFLH